MVSDAQVFTGFKHHLGVDAVHKGLISVARRTARHVHIEEPEQRIVKMMTNEGAHCIII